MPYTDLGLTLDTTQLQQDGLDYIVAQAPGWEADPLTEWILSAVAAITVEAAVLAGRVDPWIFTYFGEKVLHILALDAVAATGTVQFTLSDALGHTIDAGAQIDIDGQGFETTAPLTIAFGSSTGTVAVTAVIAGAAGNALTGTSVQLVSPTLVWVSSVSLTAATGGGQDAETGEEYVDRLADELPTLSPKAILVGDFELLPTTIEGVDLALVIDNYIPADPMIPTAAVTDAENAVTVALRGADGLAVAGGVKTLVNDLLTADDQRITGTLISLIDPVYSYIDAHFVVQVLPGWNTTSVHDQALAALQAFLSPTEWGVARVGEARRWRPEQLVRYTDLVGVLYSVEGVRHADVTFAATGDPLDVVDVALTDPVGLPLAGTITGTATL